MTEQRTENVEVAALLEFLYRLGQAYLASGEQTALVELFLRRTAAAMGVPRSRIVTFPTAIFITLHVGDDEHVTLAEGPLRGLRLDQIAAVYTLGEESQAGTVTPRQGLDRINEILKKPSRFGMPGMIAGHTILTIGLAMILMPAVANLAAAAVLGTVIGGLKAFRRDGALLSAPLSVVAATLVSALVFLAVKQGLPVNPLHALVPPLVTFLPGAMIAFGMVELAYGDMVSGSSRLVNGIVQLILLAFGLAAGAALVGVGTASLLTSTSEPMIMIWAKWVGVLVFGLGVTIHFSAPRNALPWMLLVLLVAFGGQRLAAQLLSNEVSGFFGSLLATPLSYLIQLRFKGPPSMVTFLPSFWLLVPGSLGLLSVTRMLSDHSGGMEGLTSAMFAFVSIGLGVLVGASLYKWLTEKFGLWQLKIGRSIPPGPSGT